MKNTLQVIENLNEFKFSVRNNVLKTFLLSFLKIPTFLEQYDEDLLTDNILDHWTKHFINEKKSIYYIYESDLIKLEKEVYKDFVENILGKLVDDGILSMCWDDDSMAIVWKNNQKKDEDEL